MAILMTERLIFYDGRKATPINQLPDSAWTWYTPHTSAETETLETYYQSVAWLSRGVKLRAQALSNLPFTISRGDQEIDTSGDYQNAVQFLPNPSLLLYLIEASLTLSGQAYLFRERNRVRTLALRYMVPSSVKPILDEDVGLIGFERLLPSGKRHLDVDDVVYFWLLDPFVELGPGNDSPATAALSAAGVLYNVDRFMAEFFKRGAIKAQLLRVSGNPPEPEKRKLKAWWKRLLSGVGNAWATEVVSAEGVEPVVIGEGIQELGNTELTKEKREDIATALGIPQTLLWSSTASGLGGGGVVLQDNVHFYTKTVVPEAQYIAHVLNEQLFGPAGYRFRFRPETMDIFQQDEKERAGAFLAYVRAGLLPSVAAQMLGLELPAGMDYSALDPDFGGEEATSEPPPPLDQDVIEDASELTKAAISDLRRWRNKSRKRGRLADFESDEIPAEVKALIMTELGDSDDVEQIKSVFDAVIAGKSSMTKATRFIPRGADEPLLPVPDQIAFDDADVDRAVELWDRLMPEYRGMLGASVIGKTDYDAEPY